MATTSPGMSLISASTTADRGMGSAGGYYPGSASTQSAAMAAASARAKIKGTFRSLPKFEWMYHFTF